MLLIKLFLNDNNENNTFTLKNNLKKNVKNLQQLKKVNFLKKKII